MKKSTKWVVPVLLILSFVVFDVLVVFACNKQQSRLDEMRHNGISALYDIADVKDYRKKEATKLETIISDSEFVIETLRSQDSIDEELDRAESKINKLKTAAQYKKEEKAAAEKKKREEEARRAAEEAARQKAARKAAANASKNKSSGNRGCIGNDSSNFY